MKRCVQGLLIVAAIIVIVFAFTGCDSGRDSALVGQWENTSGRETLEFFRDGTGIDTVDAEHSFSWSTRGGRLTFFDFDDDGEEIQFDYSIVDNGTRLILNRSERDTLTYIRLGSR